MDNNEEEKRRQELRKMGFAPPDRECPWSLLECFLLEFDQVERLPTIEDCKKPEQFRICLLCLVGGILHNLEKGNNHFKPESSEEQESEKNGTKTDDESRIEFSEEEETISVKKSELRKLLKMVEDLQERVNELKKPE